MSLKKLFFILFACFQVTFYFAQTKNVLFIGNSYTHMNNMPKIFEFLAKSKGKKVYADSIAVSGSTLKLHTERPTTYTKMKSRKWDYVFVQGFSRELAQDSSVIATETIPYAKMLIDSVKKYSPCASIYFYMTWGYQEGYAEQEPNNTYFKMQERIRTGYFQMSNALGYPIAPVGMVWKYVTENHPSINLYVADKQHPAPIASYISACTFYASIFKETPIGGKAPKYVDTTYWKTIQKAAEIVVLPNLSTYKLDMIEQPITTNIPPLLNFDIKETWLEVELKNKSQKVDRIYWDFGDETNSIQENPKHYYKKDGTYTVTLNAESNCQSYALKKVVTVSKQKKHANSRKKRK